MKLFKNLIESRKISKTRKNRSITVRTLVVKDFIALSDIIEKYAAELNLESVTRLISSVQSADESGLDNDSVGKQIHLIGLEILKKITTVGKTDVVSFFADVIGVTPEEFLAMPIDTPLVIIDQIRTAPEAESFFIMRSLVLKLTEQFEKPLGMLKKWYDSTSVDQD